MRHGEELAKLARDLRSLSERRKRLEAAAGAAPDQEARRLLAEALRDETLAREALLRAADEWVRPGPD